MAWGMRYINASWLPSFPSFFSNALLAEKSLDSTMKLTASFVMLAAASGLQLAVAGPMVCHFHRVVPLRLTLTYDHLVFAGSAAD